MSKDGWTTISIETPRFHGYHDETMFYSGFHGMSGLVCLIKADDGGLGLEVNDDDFVKDFAGVRSRLLQLLQRYGVSTREIEQIGSARLPLLRASKSLREHMRHQPWFRTIGLGGDKLILYVEPGHMGKVELPEAGWEGFPVQVAEMGTMKASPAR